MRCFPLIMLLLAFTVLAPYRARAGSDRDPEGKRANSVSLNGAWEYASGDGDEQAETPEGADRLRWRAVTIPGAMMPYSDPEAAKVRFAWIRRRFTVTPARAKELAILRWNQITFGAVAYVNGRKVGENAPTGPYQTLLPPGVLRSGENEVVLRIAGGAGAPKSKSGSLLVPAGFGDTRQPPAVQGDIWIDFADEAYMKWILALPDLAGSKVRLRVTPIGFERNDGLTLDAEVRPWPGGAPIGQAKAPVEVVPGSDPRGDRHAFVEVPMPGFKPWTYETPNLYTATVTLRRGAKVLDSASIRFGMREITVSNGRYRMNGKPLRFRGSNLVFEWGWGDTITGKEVDYLVTEAREMSMNAFRTHTMPPPPLWANVADEGGTMILAEFPCLFNYQDYKFTAAEWAIWRGNVLSDAAGWMARLWNHPSVVMWVLSNESNLDNAWEAGPYHDFVRSLDPTRPTMRTGTDGTAENYDVHACGNIEDLLEGNLMGGIPSWFEAAKDRPLTNSEYMNYFGRPVTQLAGAEDAGADALAFAQLGMEHTEAMRRARLDGMLPYMYAGWTRTRLAARVRETGKGSAVWKANFAAPASAAWHSALSPVLASLDLFDPDYVTGQEVTTDLVLINDSWHDAKIRVDLLLTRENPEFIPEAACFDRPVAKWSFDFALPADALTKTPVSWKLPDEEGSYWLTARTTGIAGRPVLSQRFVRAVKPPSVPADLRDRRFILLGGDAAADNWFRSRGLRVENGVKELAPDKDVVVIWRADHVTEEQMRQEDVIRSFAASGGRVIVLGAGAWNWRSLCDVQVEDMRSSRAFAYPNAKHPMWDRVRSDWLVRWNGLPGAVALGRLQGPAMAGARRLLWVRDPETTVAAEVPVAGGKGTIIFSGLDIQDRVDRSKAGYDPVAERVLLNLLRGG